MIVSPERAAQRLARSLDRPYRAPSLDVRLSQGVALGYHRAPFQPIVRSFFGRYSGLAATTYCGAVSS
jgi:hypothetical protein